MRVHIHGVRGSRPTPGTEHARFGGNTSCVSLAPDDGVPDLIIDAGTGIAGVTSHLEGTAFMGAILLSHLHWDHVHGLPFFAGGDRPDARVDLHLPEQGDPIEVLARSMSPPHFPITPDQLRGDWAFHSISEGWHRIGRYRVRAVDLPHKGGRTFGYRIEDDRSSVTYVSDHWPVAIGPGRAGHGEVHPAVLDLVDGCDLLFHDAQYVASEWASRRDLGHSTVDYAIELAETAHVGRLVLFHHDPSHDDGFLDGVEAEWAGTRVLVAREGLELDPARPTSGVGR